MGCPEELAARKLLSAEKRLNREKSVLDGSRNGRQGRDPGRMLKSDKLSTMTWVELHPQVKVRDRLMVNLTELD